MLRERISSSDFESSTFAARLVERLGWAVDDAHAAEQAEPEQAEAEHATRLDPPEPDPASPDVVPEPDVVPDMERAPA
jgi:hypothetical protein